MVQGFQHSGPLAALDKIITGILAREQSKVKFETTAGKSARALWNVARGQKRNVSKSRMIASESVIPSFASSSQSAEQVSKLAHERTIAEPFTVAARAFSSCADADAPGNQPLPTAAVLFNIREGSSFWQFHNRFGETFALLFSLMALSPYRASTFDDKSHD